MVKNDEKLDDRLLFGWVVQCFEECSFKNLEEVYFLDQERPAG